MYEKMNIHSQKFKKSNFLGFLFNFFSKTY